MTHVGYLKTSILHPASTSHRQLSKDQLELAGVSEELIRVNVGLEHIDDIIDDFNQAIEKINL